MINLKLRKEEDEELILKGKINLAQKASGAKSSDNVANGIASGGNITTVTKTMTGTGGTGAGIGSGGGSITIERTQVSSLVMSPMVKLTSSI